MSFEKPGVHKCFKYRQIASLFNSLKILCLDMFLLLKALSLLMIFLGKTGAKTLAVFYQI